MSNLKRGSEVVIALGSNLGDRGSHLWNALRGLQENGIQVLRHSALYETAPAYVTDQPSFLNAAVVAKTDRDPLQLLDVLKDLEASAGRQSGGVRFGPRPLDLDILFYGGLKVDHERLQIPHPRWRERSFVKAPVSDLHMPSSSPQASQEPNVQQALCEVHLAWGSEEQARTDPTRRGRDASLSISSQLPPGQGEVMRRVTPLPRGRFLCWGERTHVMGILNATPDSFSDGGKLLNADGELGMETAMAVARRMVLDGADILDVGGQSTRPGSIRISEQAEAARVVPLIRAMRQDPELKGAVVSCDTFSAYVAREAVAAGADIVNDVSGGSLDPGMLAQVAELGVPYVLMHMRGDLATMQQEQHTRYGCVWHEVGMELQSAADRAMQAGIPAWSMVLDPGIGFSKTAEGNLELLRHLGDMRRSSLQGAFKRGPLLMGPSRKSFLGKITGHTEPAERDAATVAAAVACVAGGGLADIVRAHNVKDVRDGVRVADALYRI